MSPRRNLIVLFACQALYWGAVIIGITLSAVVGSSLAPEPLFATLPAALLTVGAIFTTTPVSLMMQRYGRRAGFRVGTVAGIAGGALCAASIVTGSFIGFCVGNLALGIYQACANYYRLAATDSVPPERSGRAVAWVMAGGVVAALVGPTLSIWTKDVIANATYAGSYVVVAALSLIATWLIGQFCPPEPEEQDDSDKSDTPASIPARRLSQIISQPIFIAAVANAGVSHGVMILVMTTTPLAMLAHQLTMSNAAIVIQWHVLGMFLPAFFSGKLVDKFGAGLVSLVGAIVFAVSITLAASGTALSNFWVSSMLLGVGWNLMYVAGTTLIARSHRPAERGRVQGVAELGIAMIAAVSAFSSGALLTYFGWRAVNVGATPLLIIVVLVTLWFMHTERQAQASPA
ncbi:MAG: MFS transporter [Gammaproteobacteria bacterium]|nr:MFS transporter [Gammaproteobacteria bacterium]